MHPMFKAIAKPVFHRVAPMLPKTLLLKYKEYSEFSFWKKHTASQKERDNAHYKYFYTEFFSLDPSWFAGKRVIDVGCGPLGSLEWASMAAERCGLDPLVDRYRELGIDNHSMKYINAPVEKIPCETGAFDVVTSLNSLDHVEDLDLALKEMARILSVGGTMLIIVEVNHNPRPTEPIEVRESDLKTKLADMLAIEDWRAYNIRDDHDVYASLRHGIPTTLNADIPGIIAARCQKLA